MELETNLLFWLSATFFLGLVAMAAVYVFMEGCEKI